MWRPQKILKNYVTMEVVCDSSERFINICRNNTIFMWNITRTENGFICDIEKNDFLKLKNIIRKTHAKIKIKKRHGINFIIFKYRKHYSFLVGIIIAICLINLCSLYVWNISFDGNCTYTDKSLLKFLESNGIKTGMKMKNINCDMIETCIRNEYCDVTWVSAQIKGTRLIVHIKENDGTKFDSAVKYDNRDIVAAEDGVISSIITRKGTPKVKKGDAVTKGQILVSGIVEIKDDSGEITQSILTSADADICINASIPYKDSVSIKQQYKKYTGKTSKHLIIGLASREIEIGIPCPGKGEKDIESNINDLKITDSFYLPIKYGQKKYSEYKMEEKELSEEEAVNILRQKYIGFLRKLYENNVQILDECVKIKNNGFEYVCEGNVSVNMSCVDYADITENIIDGNEEKSQ